MSESAVLSQSLIESGRDIPLKELLYAKRVLHNYMVVAKDNSPQELLEEMREAIKAVEYFRNSTSPNDARNVISTMFEEIDAATSFDAFVSLATKPFGALNELIEDRAVLIKQERALLLASGYDLADF